MSILLELKTAMVVPLDKNRPTMVVPQIRQRVFVNSWLNSYTNLNLAYW